jgi:hypothetical protein
MLDNLLLIACRALSTLSQYPHPPLVAGFFQPSSARSEPWQADCHTKFTLAAVYVGFPLIGIRRKRMSKKAAEHHKKASEHHTHAAHHHGEAAKHYEGGHHEKGAHHAHSARGHATHARYHSEEAAKAHTEEHGKK